MLQLAGKKRELDTASRDMVDKELKYNVLVADTQLADDTAKL